MELKSVILIISNNLFQTATSCYRQLHYFIMIIINFLTIKISGQIIDHVLYNNTGRCMI